MTSTLTACTTEHLLVTAAAAAPSIHNTQPWRFSLAPGTGTLTVHAVPHRALPLTDPDTRALHVSVGAALCNLRAAAVHLGREPVVRLLPRPDAPGQLATVRLAGRPRLGLLRHPDLYRAIWRRRSCRLPFSPTPVPESVIDELAEAARLDGAELHRPAPAESARLLRLTAAADTRNALDPGRTAETLARAARPGDALGVPAYASGPLDAAGLLPMRSFGDPRDRPSRDRVPFEPEPRLLLLTTRHDLRADWLRAGQALQHVLLLLTLHGLRASMLHQALEWPDLRALMTAGHPDRCAPQMLLRIGYGPTGFPTPRLRTTALIDGAPSGGE
ncbi:Acg family FMN-binding oxidoreductase [Kitasatospora sp. NPDC001664]